MGSGEQRPWRVFLSHTSEFRRFPTGRSYVEGVESAVSAAGHVIVDMREFPAIDVAPAQVCQEKVRGCAVYLGIYGTRYGSPVRDRPEVSYTELEFETASDPAHPLERLVFLLDEEAENPGIPAKWLNDPTHGDRQQDFLRKVKDAGLTLQTFRNPDELARLVERSLVELKQRERARQAQLAHLQRGCQAARVPFMAPDLPIGFVQRTKEFEALRALLLDGERKDPVAITTALTGAGGFGKTTLAAALCHDEEIIQAFDDGILWTTLGETPDLADALAKLHAGLTGERPAFKDAEDAATSLAERLEGKNCLIVIDDVWDPAHLRPFLRGGVGCARLITSRLLPVATEAGASTVKVDEMSGGDAVAMLTARLESSPSDLAPWRALAQRLGEWPLALKLASAAMVGRIKRGDSLARALEFVNTTLDRRGFIALGNRSSADRDAAIASTVAVSLEHLSEEQQCRYRELAVFPEDASIPLPLVAELWDQDEFDSEVLLEQLADAFLLELDLKGGELRLHDVLRAFLAETLGAEALQLAHAALIEHWGDLQRLPHAADPAYAWRWIGYHLEAAGRQSQLDGLLLDLGWLQAKLNATGIAALEREFGHASDQPELKRLLRVLLNASHVLASQPEQLPCQLLASEALLRTLSGHGSTVNALAVLPDGRLASGSDDRTIKLWDPASGEAGSSQLRFLANAAITALAFLPGASILVAGDASGRLHWLQLGPP